MSENIHIRLAHADDVGALTSMLQSVFGLSCPADTKQQTIAYFLQNTLNADTLNTLIDSEKDYVFVAQVDAKVVGLGVIEWINKQQAEFAKLYVSQSHHGCGLGRKLADTMIAQAREAKFEQLLLHVYKNNHQAKKLYKKLGFVYYKDIPFQMADEVHDDQQYLLTL